MPPLSRQPGLQAWMRMCAGDHYDSTCPGTRRTPPSTEPEAAARARAPRISRVAHPELRRGEETASAHYPARNIRVLPRLLASPSRSTLAWTLGTRSSARTRSSLQRSASIRDQRRRPPGTIAGGAGSYSATDIRVSILCRVIAPN
jgi:hypothetical protein